MEATMKYAIYPFKRYDKYRIYVVFTDENGEEKRKSTGVTYGFDATKKERRQARQKAEKKAREILMEFFKESGASTRQEVQTYKLSDYLQDYYFPRVRANCEPATLVSYKKSLKYFMRICGDHDLSEYKRFDLETFKMQRFDKENIAKTTINIELRSIKAAFGWAYKNELLDRNPFRGQDFLFDTRPNRRAFSGEEIKALFEQTAGKMIGLVVALTYYTGMRIGEVSGLKWKMIDFENRAIHLTPKITKTSDPRSIPMSKKVFNIMKIYEQLLKKKRRNYPEFYEDRPYSECHVVQKQRGPGRYKRRSIQDVFRKEMNKAGLPKELKFHCLRHSFATHARAKGGDLGAISKVMGHSTTQVTQAFYDHTEGLDFRWIVDLL